MTATITTSERIAEWLAALRSDDFHQGRNALRQPIFAECDAFCCLGVACEISNIGDWEFDPDGQANASYLTADDGAHDGTLPPAVAAEFGLTSNDGGFWVTGKWLDSLMETYPLTGRLVAAYLGIDDCDITPHSTQMLTLLSLATLNDGGLTFPQIADVIESEPPGLFE